MLDRSLGIISSRHCLPVFRRSQLSLETHFVVSFTGQCHQYFQWRHSPRGGDTRIKLFFVAEFRKNTDDKRRGKMGVVRRRQLKKVIAFQREMTKKVVSFFHEKIR